MLLLPPTAGSVSPLPSLRRYTNPPDLKLLLPRILIYLYPPNIPTTFSSFTGLWKRNRDLVWTCIQKKSLSALLEREDLFLNTSEKNGRNRRNATWIQDINFNKHCKHMYCPLPQKLLTHNTKFNVKFNLYHKKNLSQNIDSYSSFTILYFILWDFCLWIGLSVKSGVIVLKDTHFSYLKNPVDMQDKKMTSSEKVK